jgi:AcrR family transcriptional regulator
MRRNQIIEEAFKLFARQGYGPTTMKQIGDAVGLDKSSLYVHFKNKSEIYTVILETELQSYVHDVLGESFKGNNFKEISHNLIGETLRYFSNPDKLLFWKHVMLMSRPGAYPELSEPIKNVLYHMNEIYIDRLESAITDISDPFVRLKMSLMLSITTQGLMDWLVFQDEVGERNKEIAREVCNDAIDAFGSMY